MLTDRTIKGLLYNAYNSFNLIRLNRIAKKIEGAAVQVSMLSNEEIKEKYQQLRGKSSYSKVMPVVLAMAGEVIHRILEIKPYKEQYVCALAMYFNNIAEMKSGEGKSIVSVIAAILFALENKVHIVTVNDYLAERDYLKMKAVYDIFGLTSGVNHRDEESLTLYQSDVAYSSSQELIFDYLRNELLPKEQRIEFPLEAVIIDEIDFVLLDNANSTFSVSTGIGYRPDEQVFKVAGEVCSLLKGAEIDKTELSFGEAEPEDAHYVYCLANVVVYLTREGIHFLEDFFKVNYSRFKNLIIYKVIINTLEAKLFHLKGRDYLVQDDKVVLINRVNGRIMPNSQLEEDLHTAVEVKEGVPISEKPQLCNSLSYQIFFSKYGSMVGMSGTVYEAVEEFERVFCVPVIIVPTHKENRRIDHPDLIFRTNEEKYGYLVEYLKKRNKQDQPVLVIAGTEEESSRVSQLLNENGISVNLLNNHNLPEEALLVKEAGTHGVITVSTNMSGRGTDVVLDEKAKEAGGLLVMVLNRYTSRRIDNQVRGRAGRQGEPGESVFLVSLEDEIWRHCTGRQEQKVHRIIDEENFLWPSLHEDNSVEMSGRQELTAILDRVQRSLQQDYFGLRQLNYYLDSIIETHRDILRSWKEKFTYFHKDYISKYIDSPEFNKKEFMKMFIDYKDLDISGEVHKQYSQLDEEVLDSLMIELLEPIADKHWLVYKRCMEGIKIYLPLYHLPEDGILTEYARICSDELKRMQADVMNEVIGYFISAQIEENQTDMKGVDVCGQDG